MEYLGAEPRLGQDGQNQCRSVMKGEIIGHVIALALGAPLFFLLRNPHDAFLVTWALTFFADWAGGKVGGALHSRAVAPTVEAIMNDILTDDGDSEQKHTEATLENTPKAVSETSDA